MQHMPRLTAWAALLYSVCLPQELVFKGFTYRENGLRGALAVTVSPDGNHVYAVAGSDNTVSWFTRDPSTGLLTYGGYLRDGINGVDGLAGAASVVVSPDGGHVYVAAQEDDAISWFTRDPSTGALTYGDCLKNRVGGVVLDGAVSAAADGLYSPWSVAVSPEGNHVYVAAYMENAVSWFLRDAGTGAVAYGGHLEDGIDGVDGLEYATCVAVCPSGRFVYVTARRDEALTWYMRDPITGNLTYAGVFRDGGGVVDVLGQTSSVAVSPEGRHVYVGSADRAVSCFEMQGVTGLQWPDWADVPLSAFAGTDDPPVVYNIKGQIIRTQFNEKALPAGVYLINNLSLVIR